MGRWGGVGFIFLSVWDNFEAVIILVLLLNAESDEKHSQAEVVNALMLSSLSQVTYLFQIKPSQYQSHSDTLNDNAIVTEHNWVSFLEKFPEITVFYFILPYFYIVDEEVP